MHAIGLALGFLTVGTIATLIVRAVSLGPLDTPMVSGALAGFVAVVLALYGTLQTPKEDRRRAFTRHSRYGAQDSRFLTILCAIILGALAGVICELVWR